MAAWIVQTSSGREIRAASVVLARPAHAAAEQVRDLDPVDEAVARGDVDRVPDSRGLRLDGAADAGLPDRLLVEFPGDPVEAVVRLNSVQLLRARMLVDDGRLAEAAKCSAEAVRTASVAKRGASDFSSHYFLLHGELAGLRIAQQLALAKAGTVTMTSQATTL